MYPFLRILSHRARARNLPRLRADETLVSHHLCWPVDLDPWMELNNGRTLTLYDIGRMTLMERIGVSGLLREQGWGITVAGSSVRYRKRTRLFDRIKMKSRICGIDERFFYMEQSMWVGGECTSHALLRSAVTGPRIIPPARVQEVAPELSVLPPLPDWARAWSEADGHRPWPPMQDAPDAPAPEASRAG